MACFPSGKYCDAANFGTGVCENADTFECRPCARECKACSTKDQCLECNDKDATPVIINGICSESSATCKQALQLGSFEKDSGVHETKLFNEKLNKFVNAVCIAEGDNAHTMIRCDDLLDDGASCSTHDPKLTKGTVFQDNTCTDAGQSQPRKIQSFSTANLLEDADGCCSLLRWLSADVRSAGDVVAIKGLFHSPFRNGVQYAAALQHFGKSTMERYWRTPGGIYATTEGKQYNCEASVCNVYCVLHPPFISGQREDAAGVVIAATVAATSFLYLEIASDFEKCCC